MKKEQLIELNDKTAKKLLEKTGDFVLKNGTKVRGVVCLGVRKGVILKVQDQRGNEMNLDLQDIAEFYEKATKWATTNPSGAEGGKA